MLTHNFRWSHAAGNQVVPSPWQATARVDVTLDPVPPLRRRRRLNDPHH
jgi:hypothetical protein